MSATPPSDAAAPSRLAPSPGTAATRAFTVRSVLIGTLGAIGLSALAPYNDYIIANTPLIGSYLPLVVVLALFFLAVVINAPLSRLAPRHALSARELSVILAMLLAASAIPTQGLLRYWLPMLVAPFRLGQEDVTFWQIFSQLTLPGWLFPVDDLAEGRNSPIVTYFYNRVPQDEPIPYAAWFSPLLGWSVFIISWLVAMLAMAVMVVPQWANNERLPFPIAQIQAAIIETPRPGTWFNRLFADRLFWIGLGVVFIIHNINGLSPHFPTNIPEIPLTYNLNSIFAERPWVFLNGGIKTATIYFTFIGITYFVRTRVAFSLWATFLLVDLYRVQLRTFGAELPAPAADFQHLGASIAFAAGVLWIGRHHFLRIARDVICLHRPATHPGGSYRLPAICFLLACAGMFGWLLVVGMQIWTAALLVGLILLAQVVITRFVAETGVPFFRFYGTSSQLLNVAPAGWVSPHDATITGLTAPMAALSTRESLMPMAAHALRVEQDVSPQPRYRVLVAVMGWAVLVALLAGTFSSLRMYYTHATPLTIEVSQTINDQALESRPRSELADPVKRVAQSVSTDTSYSPIGHFSAGLGITALLQVLTLRFTSWPLLPVGYVACFTWYMGEAWYSLMLGWLIKVLLIRFGGASLFQKARPLFIGLIFGEALAAATWLVINLLLASMGYTYHPVHVLPV